MRLESPNDRNRPRLLYVSNQRSELDLLAVKSCSAECGYVSERGISTLARFLLAPVWHEPAGRAPDYFSNPKNYPLVVFPEQTATRSRTLLTFDSAAFLVTTSPSSDASTSDRQMQPVAVQLYRPILPLAVNLASPTMNILLVLFSPVNIYRITFLSVQSSADQCREAIAAHLGASLSPFNHEDIHKALIRVNYTF